MPRIAMSIASALYSSATCLLSLALFPLFMTRPRGRYRIWERYGRWGSGQDEVIWFHGASAGEMNGIVPVMRSMREHYPGLCFLATCTSPSGLDVAAQHAELRYLLPFDSGAWIGGALRRVRPKLFVFAETELWPGLLARLEREGVPSAMINARISDFSIGHYRLARPLVAPALRRLSCILTASEEARTRLIELGADPSVTEVCGNSKYDLKPSLSGERERGELRARFFEDGAPVLVLGSLRPGEEDLWFPALAEAYAQGKRLNVIVAPRHREKFDYFADRLSSSGLSFRRWSGGASAQAPVVLLDAFGVLEQAYSFADLAFVGATLVNIGGHNPLEPAAYGVAVALGPYAQNVRDIRAELERRGACLALSDRATIGHAIELVASRSRDLSEMGQRAREVWAANHGASARIVDRLAKLLPEESHVSRVRHAD